MKVNRRHTAQLYQERLTIGYKTHHDRWPGRVVDIGGRLLHSLVLLEDFNPGYSVRLHVHITTSTGDGYHFPLTSQGF